MAYSDIHQVGDLCTSFPYPAILIDEELVVISSNHMAKRFVNEWSHPDLDQIKSIIPTAIKKNSSKEFDINITLSGDEHNLTGTVVPVDKKTAFIFFQKSSFEKKIHQALLESRQRYKDIVEISSDFAWEVGENGCFVFVSPKGALGWQADELIGQNPKEFIISEGKNDRNPFCSLTPLEEDEITFQKKNGNLCHLIVNSVPLLNERGEWIGTRGLCKDITHIKFHEKKIEKIRKRERIISQVIKTTNNKIVPYKMFTQLIKIIEETYQAYGTGLFRKENEGFKEVARNGLLPPQKAITEFIQNQKKHISFFNYRGKTILSALTHYHNEVNGTIIITIKDKASEIDEADTLIDEFTAQIGTTFNQISYQEELEKLSSTDSLTGLLNRRVFYVELEKRIKHILRTERSGCLMYIDLDNFKYINDTFGHNVGDHILKEVGKMLSQSSRAADLASRLGGDEFSIWLEETDIEGAQIKAENILKKVSKLSQDYVAPKNKKLGCSIGISSFDAQKKMKLQDLIDKADKAMYKAKKSGKNNYEAL